MVANHHLMLIWRSSNKKAPEGRFLVSGLAVGPEDH